MIKQANIPLSDPIIGGKDTRQQSVFNGLLVLKDKANPDDIVLIHDAARPFVQTDDIQKLIEVLDKCPAGTLYYDAHDTTHYNDKTIDRRHVKMITTPQGFSFKTIYQAHETHKDTQNFTDDIGLTSPNLTDIAYIPSNRYNIKITTMDDYHMAQNLISHPQLTSRSALGFDVHAFETKEENTQSNRQLILGGVTIDHPVGLKGHSDADVVLHAITDAILGGMNQGDIGTHFPPSDPQWKDCDSIYFLKEAAKMAQNYKICLLYTSPSPRDA